MTATSPNCVSLTWNPVSGVSSYKVVCTGYHPVTVQDSRWSDICEYSPYTPVTCSVTCILSQSQESDEYIVVPVNITSYSGCADPTTPEFNVQDVVQSFSENRPDKRKLTVHITSASQPNCATIKSYTIRLYKTGESSHIATRTIISHGEDVTFEDVKAATDYTVTIVAVNNYDKQSPLSNKTITTQELAPEAVSDLTLTPDSPYCLNMTWSPPVNTNGIILSYKYSCTGQETLITDSANVTDEMICGFTPFQDVTCNLRAVNSYSDGLVTNGSVTTLCTNPTEVSDIQIVQGTHDVNGHQRRNISITWLGSRANCESITEYNITLLHIDDAGETILDDHLFAPETQQFLRHRTMYSKLVGGEVYKIQFVSANNLDMISETVQHQFQADDLCPYDGVSDFQLRSNSSCVNMTWIPPQESNGLISYYEFTCQSSAKTISDRTIDDDSFSYIENTNKMQYLACKLPSETLFNCSIRAGNNAGLSPMARSSIYTKFNYGEINPPVINVNDDHNKISVQLKPVLIHHGTLQAQYYLIIVEELSYPGQLSQVDDKYLYNSEFAKSQNLTYYVAAKLLFDEQDPDMFFLCGDGRFYGGYYNAPLSTTKLYKIHYAFAVKLNGTVITHVVKSRRSAISLSEIPLTTMPVTAKPTTKLSTTPSTKPPSTDATTTTTTTTTTAIAPTTVHTTLSSANTGEVDLPPSTPTAIEFPPTVDIPTSPILTNPVTTVNPKAKVTNKPTTVKATSEQAARVSTGNPTIDEMQDSTVAQVKTTVVDHWQGVDEKMILRELRCPDPPAVKHADLHDAGQRRWNSTVSYHCDDGYSVLHGSKDTVILTCTKSQYSIELDWSGEILHCMPARKAQAGDLNSNQGEKRHGWSKGLLAAVCLVLILLVVLIAVGAVFFIRRKRKKYQLANQNEAPQPSIVELTERRNGHSYTNNHYATPIVNKHPHRSDPCPQSMAAETESQKCLLADDETISYADDDDFSQ